MSAPSDDTAKRLSEAIEIVHALQPERPAREIDGLALLGLVRLETYLPWSEAQASWRTVEEIHDFATGYDHGYMEAYSYESIQQALTGFIEEGWIESESDSGGRRTGFKSVYRIKSDALLLVRAFSAPDWTGDLVARVESLSHRQREQALRLQDETNTRIADEQPSAVLDPSSTTTGAIDPVRPPPRSKTSAPEQRGSGLGDPQFDGIIKELVDGSDDQRSETLSRIRSLSQVQASGLALRLCLEIEGRFSIRAEKEFSSASREPKKIASIRSWMLSSLIWSDAEGFDSRKCIFDHLQVENEPDPNVRFWTLAGLYMRRASYLEEAVHIGAADGTHDVASLARAILSPEDKSLHELFRADLRSTNFETAWQALRVLRVIPIPELAPDVCDLLGKSEPGTPLGYDALNALTHPRMGREAASILSVAPGVDEVVARILQEVRGTNKTAVRNFAVLLAQFDPTEVDDALREARRNPQSSESADLVVEALEAYRLHAREPQANRPAPGAIFQKTFSAFVPDHAAYGRRTTGAPLDDALGVGVYAEHLAQLIAAKDTWMPLSIGLFGAWGAGKSHFIDLLDENLGKIANNPGEVFYRHIVPIRFNAWHYLDTNLWANLVCEIFDQLFLALDRRDDTKAEQVDRLKSELVKQSALAAEANEALKAAQNARKAAEEQLRSARQERVDEEKRIGALLDDLGALVLSDTATQEQLKEVAEGLGLPKLQTSFSELEARAGEVRSLGGRTKALALAIFERPGRWQRGLLLLAALTVPVALAWLAGRGTQAIQPFFASLVRIVTLLVTAIGSLSAWISKQVRDGNAIVSKLENAYEQVKKLRDARASQSDAAKAKADLVAKRQAEDEALHTLGEIEERLKSIRTEMAEMAPGRQLIRFLKERASAEDYKRHLGMVSLVRKDFEQLSNLLTKAEESARNGKAKDAESAIGNDEGSAAKKDVVPLPKVDRIVLYIDDLDRCRADRVIEVLEAVHLLLAFPLFAVVVAVDPRWLRQSLLDHYPRLLGGADDSNGANRVRNLGRPATPQDYLEKIFQVPFNLQAMEEKGYKALVRRLFAVEAKKHESGVPRPHDPVVPEVTLPAEQLTHVAPKPMALTDDSSGSGTPADSPRELAQVAPKPKTPDPRRLTLTDREVQDIESFQPLFQTPRAVKRLANTYCLIRVGIEESSWDDFLGVGWKSGTYRLPMLLLAVASSFPSLSRPWLLWLREAERKSWILEEPDVDALSKKHADTTDAADWCLLASAMGKLNNQDWPRPDPKALEFWVPRVARYSF